MSEMYDGDLSLVSSATFGKYIRVEIDSNGQVAAAGASSTAKWIGVSRKPAHTAGDVVSVIPRNKAGTVPIIASNTISAADFVEVAAAGKVATQSSGTKMGIAISAANPGDQCEVLLFGGSDA